MPYSRRAEIYDVEYSEFRDVDFIRSLLGGGTIRVLEMPCGAGRLSNFLAQEVSELTIVDLEPAMVARTLESIAKHGCPAKVSGQVCDMRLLDLAAQFDLVIIPREALQLLPPDDGAKALNAAARHVAPGGRLFIDMATFSGNQEGPTDPDYFDPAREGGVWRKDWTRTLGDGAALTRHSIQSDDGNSVFFELRYEIDQAGKRQDSWMSQMRLYRYERSWIDETIPPNLSLEAVYGDYAKAAFSRASRRMLALFRNNITSQSLKGYGNGIGEPAQS